MIDIQKIYQMLMERLTIPPNDNDEIEKKIRRSIPANSDHGDRIIRWYRNERKAAVNTEDAQKQIEKAEEEAKKKAESEGLGEEGIKIAVKNAAHSKEKEIADAADDVLWFQTNILNIIDELRSEYDEILRIAKAQHKMGKFQARMQNGANSKIVELDPRTFLDQKYMRWTQARDLIRQFKTHIVGAQKIDTGSDKYAIAAEDMDNIRLVGQNATVCVWETRTFESTNKLVFQLWQNAESMDDGSVWGYTALTQHQSPYCTHAKSHWDSEAVEKGWPAEEYRQFWYLKKLPGVVYSEGSLKNPATAKTFQALKNTGPETICALNDSNTCWNDSHDSMDQFGDDTLIDKMVEDGYYNFNGEGKAVADLFHKLFATSMSIIDTDENVRMFTIDYDQHYNLIPKLINPCEIQKPKAYLRSEGYKKISIDDLPITYMYNKKIRLSEYIDATNDIDQTGELKFKILPVDTYQLMIDIPVRTLKNCPSIKNDHTVILEIINNDIIENLDGFNCLGQFNLKVEKCGRFKSLSGMQNKIFSLSVTGCPNFNMPQELTEDMHFEKAEYGRKFEMDLYQDRIDNFPKYSDGIDITINLKNNGVETDLTDVVDKCNGSSCHLTINGPGKVKLFNEYGHTDLFKLVKIKTNECTIDNTQRIRYYMNTLIKIAGFGYGYTELDLAKYQYKNKLGVDDITQEKLKQQNIYCPDDILKHYLNNIAGHPDIIYDLCKLRDWIRDAKDELYRKIGYAMDDQLKLNLDDMRKRFPDVQKKSVQKLLSTNFINSNGNIDFTNMSETPEKFADGLFKALGWE